MLSPGRGGVYAAALFSTQPHSSQATHLLSGAADGSLTMWQAGQDWTVLKNMTGHRCGGRKLSDCTADKSCCKRHSCWQVAC